MDRMVETNNNQKDNDNKNEITLNNGEYILLSYDIENNQFFKNKIRIPIITSLNGLSELNLNSRLYLCGTKSTGKEASSYLFEITFENLKTQVMVSSQYGHHNPSLISINSNKILCVGGKRQKKCEIYDIIINHWAIFPELPEERYKCSLCFDYRNKLLFLFGGINNSKNALNNNYIEKENILMIKTKNYYYSWEQIIIESRLENKLLTRISSATLFLDEDNILLIGGENENGKSLKNIIKFNTKDYSLSLAGKNLDFASKFINQSTIFENNEETNNLYFFDSKNNVHNINRQQILLQSQDKNDFRLNIKI